MTNKKSNNKITSFNLEDMKAMILAAGLGTRLRPLTNTKPKALVEFNGKPLVVYIIEKLHRFGFNELIINVHHFADQIKDFINNHYPYPAVQFSDESDVLLDTGGGLYHASPFLKDGPFLAHNVDVFSDIDLLKLFNAHIGSDALCTLAVSKRETSRSLLFDDQMNLRGWRNNRTGETKIPGKVTKPFNDFAYSGVSIYNTEIFGYMEGFSRINPCFSVIDVFLEATKTERINAYEHTGGKWFDMGKKESYELPLAHFEGCL